MSDTRPHPEPEPEPSYVKRERELGAERGSASRAIGYRRPRRDADYDPTLAEPTLSKTRVFRRETERSPGSDGKLTIRIVNEYGKPEMMIRCANIAQCREVVRVESPLYEPGSLFFIADGTKPIENWAIGKDGLPKRGRVR
jgi:hypothetical protein